MKPVSLARIFSILAVCTACWLTLQSPRLGAADSLEKPDLTIVVAPDGADANDGLHQPVATLSKALSLIDRAQAKVGEIVIRGGNYQVAQPIQIHALKDQPERKLLIRAAAGETPVFEGGQAVAATPLAGEEGIYLLAGAFPSVNVPQIWEENNRVRYRGVSGLDALRGTDYGVFVYSPTQLAIRPRGGILPPPGELRVATVEYGLEITRDHVTVDGLSFRGFGKSYVSAAIGVGFAAETQGLTDNVAIQNCRAENDYSGFFIRSGARHVTIRACAVRNVASGINQRGGIATVENCDIRNDDFGASAFAFRDSDPMTGNTGILTYYNSVGGHFRDNTIKGFKQGIFIKTPVPEEALNQGDARFIIENNTLIDDPFIRVYTHGTDSLGIDFVHYDRYDKDKAVIRNNVIDGFSIPFRKEASDANRITPYQATVDQNLLWNARTMVAMDAYTQFFRDRGMGDANRVADPQFADRKAGDYRLLPSSPAVVAGWRNPADARQVLQPGERYRSSVRVEVPAISAKQGYASSGAVVVTAPALVLKLSAYGWGDVKQTRIRVLSGTRELSSDTHDFQAEEAITLPVEKGAYTMVVAVRDGQGAWSEETRLQVQNQLPDFSFAKVTTRANRAGFVAFNPDNKGFYQSIQYRKKGDTAWTRGFDTLLTYGSVSDVRMRKLGSQPMVVTGLEPDTMYEYQIVVKSSVTGQTREYTTSPVFQVKTVGEPVTYYLSPHGDDVGDRGSRTAPLRTLQYALDLTLPGDTLRLLPGVYHGASVMIHSGTAAHPITIEAEQPGTAILSADKEYGAVLLLSGVSHVKIRNLNLQWADSVGLSCDKCESVEIAGNTLLNAVLGAHDRNGQGITISESTNTWVHHNLIYGWWSGMGFFKSPNTRIEHNTILATSLTGIQIGAGSTGSTILYNSLNFTGNHALEFSVPDLRYADLKIDFNNYGTSFQPKAKYLADPDMIFSRTYFFLSDSREFIYSYYPLPGLTYQVLFSFSEWKNATGYDGHSVFADPLWVDPLNKRFDVKGGSKNRLPDGDYIGVQGHLTILQ